MTVVVDASAWYLASGPKDDPRAPEAVEVLLRLEEAHEVHAPGLIGYELAQVIHAKRGAGESLAIRRARLENLLNPLILDSTDWSRLGGAAETHGLSAYDAAYLELADRLQAALLTEDDRLHKAAVKALGARRAWRLKDAGKAVE